MIEVVVCGISCCQFLLALDFVTSIHCFRLNEQYEETIPTGVSAIDLDNAILLLV